MYARSRGWRIHYVVEGSGPALVLVPGLMASASSWADAGYVLRFSDEFQVIAVDPLGHGKSDSPTEGEAYLVDQCALDILAVLDAEGVEAAHVWGYSRGGLLASVLATEHPRRMRSLVVGGSGFLTMPPPVVSAFSQPLRRKAEALRVGDWNEYWTLMGLNNLAVRGALQYGQDSHVVAAILEGRIAKEPAIDLSGLPQPPLVYLAEREPGFEFFEQQARAINAEFHTVRGRGHYGAFQDVETIAPIVRHYLTSARIRT